MKELINNFILTKDVKKIDVPMYPIEEYVNIFKELGYHYANEEFETNGWEVDFWAVFQKGFDVINLSGSLYYGNYKLIKG